MKTYLKIGLALALLIAGCASGSYDCNSELAAVYGNFEGNILFVDSTTRLVERIEHATVEVTKGSNPDRLLLWFTCDSTLILRNDTVNSRFLVGYDRECWVFEKDVPVVFLSFGSDEPANGWFDPATDSLYARFKYPFFRYMGYVPEFYGKKL